jgi:hypothetical protein
MHAEKDIVNRKQGKVGLHLKITSKKRKRKERYLKRMHPPHHKKAHARVVGHTG